MHLAHQLPDFASQTVAFDCFEAFVEAMSDALMGQVFNLQTQACLDPVLGLDFLDGVHQNDDPLVLGVRLLQIKLVDWLVEQAWLHHRRRVFPQRTVAISDPLVILQGLLVRQ